MAWLDYARDLLPTNQVRGFLDSAYYVDTKPLSSTFIGFQKITELATQNFYAVKLRDYNKECTDQHPGDQKWKCVFGQHLAPYVKTPYFLVTSQYDSWQLSHLVHDYDGIEAHPTYTAAETAYVNNFGLATRNALVDLSKVDMSSIFGVASNHVTIFSPACYSHHETEKPLFWERKDASGTTVMDAFIMFLNQNKQYIDKCTSYNCQCDPLPSAAIELGGTDSFSTTMASVTTTTFPCSRVDNQTVCQSTTCKGYHWRRSQCVKVTSGGSSTALLVTLLVLVLVMGIGIGVFLIFAKLRRKNGGGDNFLVIGEPV